MADERTSLILEESRRALDQQERVLDNLRARTGVLLTAASITSSFLGATALADGEFCVWTVLALATFAGVGWWAVCATRLLRSQSRPARTAWWRSICTPR
jgi:hypothetical protein